MFSPSVVYLDCAFETEVTQTSVIASRTVEKIDRFAMVVA
jgi:hypothetical protein